MTTQWLRDTHTHAYIRIHTHTHTHKHTHTHTHTHWRPSDQPQPSHNNNVSFLNHCTATEAMQHRAGRGELTVGSRVCSKVSSLWSSSWWWEAADTRCTANTPRATKSRWLSSGSGRRWAAGILHTRTDGDSRSLRGGHGWGACWGERRRERRPESRTAAGDWQTGGLNTGCF